MNNKSINNMNDDDIKQAVKNKYSNIAISPNDKFPFPVGKDFAIKVGYPKDVLDKLSPAFSESFTGANNPQPFVNIKKNEVVLDLGCGAGLDLFFYAKSSAKVYGLDISQKMLDKAKTNLKEASILGVELINSTSDNIPFDDNFFDLVASNGIYNLSPNKEAVMKEVFRVLKPGGRTVFSEIVLSAPLKDDIKKNINDWFRCIGGALTEVDFLSLMEKLGFKEIKVISKLRNARTNHPLALCANIRAYK